MNENNKLTKDEIIKEIVELAKRMTDEQISEFVHQLETNGFKEQLKAFRKDM